MMDFIEELEWRGMIHDIMPGTQEKLAEGMKAGYIGFDPTADSLHVGSLVPIMILKHFQKAGHQPFVLVGGATGMVGDPSGKSQERNLLDADTLDKNVAGLKNQLSQFLDFSNGDNKAVMVNNYDWFKDFSFLDFIRDVGKHLSVNYMMANDSVKKRLDTGMSFTEFSYQLVQGYDFLRLFKDHNCIVQLGGSDQWGNITTGTELIRRIAQGEAFAVTTPLMKKADGSKFGKSEAGNVWLDPARTSPYKFYQFWINATDADVAQFLKTFTMMSKAEIENLITQHEEDPGQRLAQKELAKQVTSMVHGEEAYNKAVEASQIVFSKNAVEQVKQLSEEDFLDIFGGNDMKSLDKSLLKHGLSVIDFITEIGLCSSKGDSRRMLKQNSISINTEKVNDEKEITSEDLLSNKYILAYKGKKQKLIVKLD